MSKFIRRIKSSPLTILFLLALVALVSVLVLARTLPQQMSALRIAAAVLFIIILTLLVFMVWRFSGFRNRVSTLLRRLVAGDYESGFPPPAGWKDEITELETLFNKLVEQLRRYDELRVTRIRELRMTLDLMLKHSAEPMALYDVAKEQLTFNDALGGLLGGNSQVVQLEALENREPNASFVGMLKALVENGEPSQEKRAAVQLPAQDNPTLLTFRIVPYKDKKETVTLVILFVKRPEP